jgi:hypothetical protein
MFRSADVGVSDDGPYMLVIHRHMSSTSPSTCLFSLCDRSHSLQIGRAARLAESSGTRAPHTRVLIFVPPDFMKEGQMRQLGHRDTHAVASHW